MIDQPLEWLRSLLFLLSAYTAVVLTWRYFRSFTDLSFGQKLVIGAVCSYTWGYTVHVVMLFQEHIADNLTISLPFFAVATIALFIYSLEPIGMVRERYGRGVFQSKKENEL